MSAPVLTVQDLGVAIGSRPIVGGVSFQVEPESTLGIVGESGSGKTMTVLAATGLIDAPGAVVTGSSVLGADPGGVELVGASERTLRRVHGDRIGFVTFGAIAALPFGIATAGSTMLRPELLGIAFAVAILSSTIPYGAELIALRRIPESTFGVLMSVEPAVAALAGPLVLGQALTVIDVLAMALVIGASAGAVITGPPKTASIPVHNP